MKVVPKRDDARAEPGELAHLSDLKDFMIADPEPDIRGWEVVLRDGRKVGKVDDVIVDTSRMVVKYIEAKVDHHVLGTDEDQWVLIPIGAARLHEEHDEVVIDRLPTEGLAGAPRYARGIPTREQERELREYYEPATRFADAGEDGLFDARRFWGTRRAGRERAPYISRRARETGASGSERGS